MSCPPLHFSIRKTGANLAKILGGGMTPPVPIETPLFYRFSSLEYPCTVIACDPVTYW